MNKRIMWALSGVLLLMNLFISGTQAADQKLTVLNPLGQPPSIARVPMAPRLDSMHGKTIYIVDIGFTDTHQLLTELADLLGKRYPDTKFIVRNKIGTYFQDDPKLWAEIKKNGDAMIIGVGH